MNGAFEWLSRPDLAALLAALNSDGEEARVVGGAVRNALLGEPVHEWDLTTTALPSVVIERGEARGWKVVPTGIDHGTVTVVIQGQPFEVTTLREDVETDGRYAVVRFGRDFVSDAMRRDFTINALSVDPDGNLHDPVGGQRDLAERRVRFIGDARTRIAEDALRILRFFRFFARYGEGEPDAAALAATIAGRGGMTRLSRERIRHEFLLILVARRAGAALEAMAETGLFGQLLAIVPRLAIFERMAAGDPAHDPIVRLAALACHVAEDAERLTDRLRLSNAEARRLHRMVEGAEMLRTPPIDRAVRALVHRLGASGALDTLRLAEARDGSEHWSAAISCAKSFNPPSLPWRAADLVERGVPRGPRLGAVLRALEQRWCGLDFPSDPNALEKIVEAVLADSEV
jgi:poly(A) polymerase